MTGIKAANLALRFALELCALAALGYWGFRTAGTAPARIALGIGAPLRAAVAWGRFVAPKARVRVSEPARLAVELGVFGAAAAALAAAGRPALAVAMAAAVAVSSTPARVGGPA